VCSLSSWAAAGRIYQDSTPQQLTSTPCLPGPDCPAAEIPSLVLMRHRPLPSRGRDKIHR
jgi:hypothetical protein